MKTIIPQHQHTRFIRKAPVIVIPWVIFSPKNSNDILIISSEQLPITSDFWVSVSYNNITTYCDFTNVAQCRKHYSGQNGRETSMGKHCQRWPAEKWVKRTLTPGYVSKLLLQEACTLKQAGPQSSFLFKNKGFWSLGLTYKILGALYAAFPGFCPLPNPPLFSKDKGEQGKQCN